MPRPAISSHLVPCHSRSLPVDTCAIARVFISELIRFVAVAECGTDAIAYAAGLGMSDFEDAMQVAAARACGARFVVTRNARDFRRSPIPAIAPQEALEALF